MFVSLRLRIFWHRSDGPSCRGGSDLQTSVLGVILAQVRVLLGVLGECVGHTWLNCLRKPSSVYASVLFPLQWLTCIDVKRS